MRWGLLAIGVVLAALAFFIFESPAGYASAATNLIPNGTFEAAASATRPVDWRPGHWGTASATFTYPAAGQNGNGAKVSVSSYASGASEWYMNPVSITGGHTYEYSDSYTSSVPTVVTLQYTLSDGSFEYPDIAHPAASSGWQSESVRFVAPANAVKVAVLHLIKSNGTLTIDNASLTDVTPAAPPPPSGGNLITNPSVEYSNGNGAPTGWLQGGYGTNTPTFTYPVAGEDGADAIRVAVTSYSSGDAKWYFNYVPVTAGNSYTFSDYYEANASTRVVAAFKMSNGSFAYVTLGNPGPASGWTKFSHTVTAPSGAVSVSVFHLLYSTGTLTTDNYSLTAGSSTPPPPSDPVYFDKGYVTLNFDDGYRSTYDNALPILQAAGFKGNWFVVTGYVLGQFPAYMTESDVQHLQASGQIVDAHTRTHPDLTSLSTQDAWNEINGSRQDLFSMGITPVDYFAYPFGAYNSSVQSLVRQAGFKGARSSDGTYNTKQTDQYALTRAPMVNTTTLAQAENYISTAMKNHTWVILLFHEVDTTGNSYAVTPQLFQEIINYLEAQGITPITIQQGLALMNS